MAAAPIKTMTTGSDPMVWVCCHADLLFFFLVD